MSEQAFVRERGLLQFTLTKGFLAIELGLRLALFEFLRQVSALSRPKRWRQNSNSVSPSETSMVNNPLVSSQGRT